MSNKPKLIAIVGSTATGKSGLAIHIAKKFNGEVVSADSRQVYTGLDIGTGKVTKKEMHGVPHHLLDVANPKQKFTVEKFKILAEQAIDKIIAKGKVPIICGGTGFYLQSVIDNVKLPDVAPNEKLREKLSKLATDKLIRMLEKLDSERLSKIDRNNRVRIIRAIEIAKSLGHVPRAQSKESPFLCLQIGIEFEPEELRQKINKRLFYRLKRGMVAEAENLHKKGLSWKRMEELGLEYRYLAKYLKKEITKDQMISKLQTEIWHYARRQRTWFKRDNRIRWHGVNAIKEIEKEVNYFLMDE